MEIYLVQHGACKSKEEDPERSLTEVGKEKIAAVCQIACRFSINPKRIEHSTKKRARETAAIISRTFSITDFTLEVEGLAPMDDVKSYWEHLVNPDGLMVVGHLPFLSKLASLLITGDENDQVISFSQGAINKLISEDGEKWTVELVIPSA